MSKNAGIVGPSAVLRDAEVLLLDCQSTGANPSQGHLLEIGWARLRGTGGSPLSPDDVETHLVALPEGQTIPERISTLTGISQDDMATALAPDEVWRRLLGAAEGIAAYRAGPPRELFESRTRAMTIIHFAQFEKKFLNWLHSHHGVAISGVAFPLDIVCSHAVAKKLLPQLPRRGLRALAGYFGGNVEEFRRCASHVAATALVWRHLVDILARDYGVRTVGEMRAWLRDPKATVKKRHLYPMSREKRLALPDRPGVYRMLRQNGDLLYVGKATSLRTRVNSYFRKQTRIPEKTLEMLTQARNLDVTATATALEAALLENDEIKSYSPPYNVALRGDRRALFFARRDFDELATRPTRHHRLGPLASPNAALSLGVVGRILLASGDAIADEAALVFDDDAAPERDCLEAGFALFRDRYLDGVAAHRRLIWSRLMRVGAEMWQRRLAAMDSARERRRLAEESQEDEEFQLMAVEQGRRSARANWDPPRVSRAFARIVRVAAHSIRRASWLCRLSESTLVWTVLGNGRPRRRVLVVSGGRIIERDYLDSDAAAPIPPGHRRSPRQRRDAFDVATYDRMRILTTEIRRLALESPRVELRLCARSSLGRSELMRTLRWV